MVQTVLASTDAFFKNKPHYTWDGRLFTTVADFEVYLNSILQLSWVKGVTIHHTWKPTLATWKQHTPTDNLKGLIRTWRDENGWDTGPNMVIGPEGIYLASGILAPGIHATICNRDHIGIEIVGDYDNQQWPEPINSFVYGAVIALVRKFNLKSVNGHRECNSPKTCPGTAIDLDAFRRTVLTPTQDRTVIGVQPSITLEQFKKYLTLYKAPLPEQEMEDVYEFAKDLDVDPAFFAAVWKQEAFIDGRIGNSVLQNQSNNAINVAEESCYKRRHVVFNGRKWNASSTRKLGAYFSIQHLKEVHGAPFDGAAPRLTVRQIIPVHAPASDGNSPETFIANVFTRMDEMKRL